MQSTGCWTRSSSTSFCSGAINWMLDEVMFDIILSGCNQLDVGQGQVRYHFVRVQSTGCWTRSSSISFCPGAINWMLDEVKFDIILSGCNQLDIGRGQVRDHFVRVQSTGCWTRSSSIGIVLYEKIRFKQINHWEKNNSCLILIILCLLQFAIL